MHAATAVAISQRARRLLRRLRPAAHPAAQNFSERPSAMEVPLKANYCSLDDDCGFYDSDFETLW